jgi:hypothetical protein
MRTSHQDKTIKETIWPFDIFGHPKQPVQQAQPKDDADEDSTSLDHATTSTASQSDVNIIMEQIQRHGRRTDFKAPESKIKVPQEEDEAVAVDDSKINVLQEDEDVANIPGEIAHLVPASPLHASLFHFVAGWAFGLDSQRVAPEVVQKLIHGCQSGDNSRRLDHTGLKHLASNKIRLRGQKEYYDKLVPNVLIVPICNLVEAKNWNGEDYHAIVLIGAKKEVNLMDIAGGIGMQQIHELATRDEIEKARELLTATLKGMAQALQKFKPNNAWAPFLAEKHQAVLTKLLDNFPAEGTVMVPTAMEVEEQDLKVCKIQFVKQGSREGHPAPDPLLLVVKAAINWSAFHNQRLLSGGEVQDDDTDNDSSYLSILAEEQYLEWCDAQARLEPLPFTSISISTIKSSRAVKEIRSSTPICTPSENSNIKKRLH